MAAKGPNPPGEQASLFGLAAEPTDRLFFALYPDAATAERIALIADEARSQHRLKARPMAADRFHVTLNHLGDYDGLPADIIAKAREAGASLAASVFDVAFDRLESFMGRTNNAPLVLRGDEGLRDLIVFQQKLGEAMMKSGLARQVEKTFTPHVTLLYDGQRIESQPIEPIGWTAREFVLVHSRLRETKHIILDRWTLAD